MNMPYSCTHLKKRREKLFNGSVVTKHTLTLSHLHTTTTENNNPTFYLYRLRTYKKRGVFPLHGVCFIL